MYRSNNIENQPPSPLKLESLQDHQDCIDIDTDNTSNTEEKESSNDLELSYCRGLSKTPLAVPMVAATLDKSVTRNDAKAITSTRLRRLKELSQQPEEHLSKTQQHEKNRIIRLEKNRRAAAMSRRKKKMYVKNLEDKCELMARHLAILEMENAQLRALVNASHHNINGRSIPVPQQMSAFKIPNMPHFQISPNTTNFATSSNSNTSNSNTPNADTTNSNSKELTPDITSSEPPFKRRKLNDGSGSSVNGTTSNSSMDVSLEPLPINTESNDNKTVFGVVPPRMPVNYMQMPPRNLLMHANIANLHPMRMMSYPMHFPHHIRNIHHESEYQSVENKSESNDNNVPPEIELPPFTDGCDLSLLDDDTIDETVDECGSVIGVDSNIKSNEGYL